MSDALEIFELAINVPLFPLPTFGLVTEAVDEEHSHLIKQILGENVPMDEASFKVYLSHRLPSEFGPRNAQQLASFLFSMLQLDLQRRKSTAEMLCEPSLRTWQN